MIINEKDIDSEQFNAHGGKGLMNIKFVFKDEQGYGNKNDSGWNCFAVAFLPVGATAGYHKHEDTDEFFYVLEGEATLTLDGKNKTIKKGDIILTKIGSSHGIKNVKKALKFIVVEIFKRRK